MKKRDIIIQTNNQILKRCVKCILPETFPGIEFDQKGVCNYCRDYIKKGAHSKEKELLDIFSEYRGQGGKADCLVTFSGGRDSSFVLYQLVKKYNMKTIAFTYDWGMLTPEAHRNMKRITEKLNVEHIIIRPDIERIKKYIRKNIKAWLKRPHLGLIPIFTHADKSMIYYTNKIAKKYDIPLVVMADGSSYETTVFKTAFLGVNEPVLTQHISIKGKIKLLLRYLFEYIKNPGYVNGSLIEMFKSFILFYLSDFPGKVKCLSFYEYINWDEDEILSTIRQEFNWKSPKDTILTWRTDDCTAPFYNYLYYIMVGFTENDTFRSNQVRDGILSRELALKIVREENRPRVKAINKYFEHVGLDMDIEKLDKQLNLRSAKRAKRD